jgi:hypothetical protein
MNQDMAASAYREPSAPLIVLCDLFIFGALYYLLDFPFFPLLFSPGFLAEQQGCAQHKHTR